MIVDIDIEKIFDKLFALTHSFAKEISRDFTIDILRTYKKGENPISVLYAMLDVIQIQVIDAMVAAHLEGYLRSVIRASEHLVKPTAFSGFDNAVKFAKDRLKLSKTNIAVLKQRYGATAINATMGMGEVVEKRIKKALSEIVERNYHIKQGMTHLSAAVKKAGISGTNPWMIETMVRTNIHIAYGAGRWDANQDSAIQAILWGYEYVTVGDFRVRPEHEMLEGVTLPKEDPQWSQIWPPNGFSCRCDVLEIYTDETRRQKIKEIPQPQLIQGHLVTPGPDEGWAINHGQVFTSDIAKSADEIRAIVAEGIAKGDTMFITDRFGKTHEVRMQWISSGPPTPSNLARWNKEFEAITKKPAWMQKIDKLVIQGKTPQWSSKFWSPKRAEYFEFASKKVAAKIPLPPVKPGLKVPKTVAQANREYKRILKSLREPISTELALNDLTLTLKAENISRQTIETLKKLIKEGKELKPLLLRRAGNTFQIWDGNHRYIAYKELYGTKYKIKVIMSKIDLKPGALFKPVPISIIKKPLAIPENIAKEMKLKGLKESYRKEVEQAYLELRKMYPDIISQIRIEHIPTLKGHNPFIAETIQQFGKGVIRLNDIYFGKNAIYSPRAVANRCYKSGYLSSPGIKGTIQHEFGHVLLEAQPGTVKQYMMGTHIRMGKETITKEISRYGSKNYHEMFAEAFSQHMQAKSSSLAKELMEIIITKPAKIKAVVSIKPAAITSQYLKALKPKWMQNIDAMIAKGKPPNWKAPFWQKYKHHRDYYKAITGKKMPKGFVKIKAAKPTKPPRPVKHKMPQRLTYEEKLPIVQYTADYNLRWNKALRNKTGKYAKEIKGLVEVLNKLPNDRRVVYRGITDSNTKMNKILKKLKEGKVINFRGFTSCSRSKSFAQDWGVPNERAKGILFKIKSKTGKYINKYSSQYDEKEVLFRPGTHFIVEKVIKKPEEFLRGQRYIIHLKEVA